MPETGKGKRSGCNNKKGGWREAMSLFPPADERRRSKYPVTWLMLPLIRGYSCSTGKPMASLAEDMEELPTATPPV